jgi:hypothetical protein
MAGVMNAANVFCVLKAGMRCVFARHSATNYQYMLEYFHPNCRNSEMLGEVLRWGRLASDGTPYVPLFHDLVRVHGFSLSFSMPHRCLQGGFHGLVRKCSKQSAGAPSLPHHGKGSVRRGPVVYHVTLTVACVCLHALNALWCTAFVIHPPPGPLSTY